MNRCNINEDLPVLKGFKVGKRAYKSQNFIFIKKTSLKNNKKNN